MSSLEGFVGACIVISGVYWTSLVLWWNFVKLIKKTLQTDLVALFDIEWGGNQLLCSC